MDSRSTEPESKPPWRLALWIGGGLLAACMATLVWRLVPERHTYYTDADQIREPAHAAAPRDILWQPPQRLSEVINAIDDANPTGQTYEARLSWDGLTLFFVRGKAGHNADIWISERRPQGWTTPTLLDGVNSNYDDLGPGPSMDGTALYFYSDRPGGRGGYDIWVSRRGEDGWLPATNLGPSVNSEFNDYGPAASPDHGTLYFASNRPQAGDKHRPDPHAWPATLREELFHRTYDLYSAAITDRGFGEAVPLAQLNSPHNEGAPAISPFGDFLYFASDRPGGSGGYDLYRTRFVRRELREPESLGAALNTSANELDPGLTMGGYALYFSSDRVMASPRSAPNGSASAQPLEPEISPAGGIRPIHNSDSAAPQTGAAPARTYNLYYTTSREVFTETDVINRPINWAALWNQILPSLVWALLALLLALLLLMLLRAGRDRKLSLLMRCLLLSLLLHSLLLLLFSFWQVASSIAEGLRSGSVQVALTSASPGDIASQILANVTEVQPPQPAESDVQPQPSDVEPIQLETAAEIPVQPVQSTVELQPQVEVAAADAPLAAPELTVQPAAHEPAPPPIQVELPTEAQRVAAAEPQHSPDLAAAPLTAPIARTELAPTSQPAAIAQVDVESRRQSANDARDSPSLVQATPSDSPTHALTTSAEPPVPASAATTTPPAALSLAVPTDASAQPAAVPEPAAPALAAAPSEPARAQPLAPTAAAKPVEQVITAPKATDIARPQDSLASEAAERVADAQPIAKSLAPPISSPATRGPMLADLRIPTPDRAGPSAKNAEAEKQAGLAAAAPAAHIASPRAAVEASAPKAGAPARSPPLLAAIAPAAADRTSARSDPGSSLVNPTARDASPRGASLTALAPGLAGPVTPSISGQPGGPSSDLMKSGLRLPTEIAPPASPYAQRAQDQREAILPRMGGSDETEKAVALALAWLARHQSPDGHWDGQHFDAACNQCTGQTDMRVNTALTGLSLLAFLGADHTHMKEGAYRDNVRRGIAWLLRQQKTDGDLRGDETMYSHGIATIALSEAYAMTGDSRLREHVRTAAEFIVAARNLRQGGWRYEPGQAADTSVTGWQVMALKSARNAGLSIDGAGFESARQWMERVASGRHSGLYAYRPRQQPTPAMTAEGMFIQQLLGVPREEPRMRESAAFVIRNLPDWDNALNTYYWYYATLALFQHQGDEWLRWNRALVKQLLPHQAKEGGQAGSWEPGGEWAPVGGRVYQTAICTLMLEVYYRYLPLYTLDRPPGSLGAIRGRVTGEDHKPLAGVTIRLEMPGLDPTVVQTGVDGRYLMQPPGKDVPDHVAITATHDGYDPQAANVPGHRLRDGDVVQDFQLSPHDKDLVSIEAVPELHHLGNNAFEGSINSQFQKEAEGDEYETTFELTAVQLAGAESAELTLLAKGVQCPHELRINDTLLETRFERTPRDGSFGPLAFEVPVELLEGGTNALHIQAIECTGDLDDFEFINVQLRLVR